MLADIGLSWNMYISVIVPISRPENVPLVAQQLNRVLMGNYIFELIIAIDNRKVSRTQVERFVCDLPLKNISIFKTGLMAPPKTDIPARRDRITKIHNQFKEHIGGSHFVFGFEDDTILPDDPVTKLVQTYSEEPTNVGYVEGVQVGRWGFPYVGAFIADDLYNPTQLRSLTLSEMDIEEIDGGGFYCFLTPTKLYKSVEHKWAEPAGPDVHYGMELRRKGYTCLIDWDVVCGHNTPKKILWPSSKTAQVKLQLKEGKWLNTVTV